MQNPKLDKMTALVRVQNKCGGIWVDARPPVSFCAWSGKDDSGGIMRGDGQPAWESSAIKLWYRPDVAVNSRILLDDKPYGVSSVENVDLRNKYLLVKLRRLIDLTELKLYKPVPQDDGSNEYPNVYGMFEGSAYPQSTDNTQAGYGLNLAYDFVMYTSDDIDIRELDRFGADSPDFEVVTIQEWPHYKKIIARRVI